MKKITSFILALLMFAVFFLSLHAYIGKYELDGGDNFGTWFNSYKDLSYAALSENIHDNTVLLLGSSEFRHGRKTPYHPKNLFDRNNVNLMMIGGPYNQSLFHAVAVGALEPKLKNRKAVFLISPTWFTPAGVKAKNYALRFSETEYIAFMNNPNVPQDAKEYVAYRSEKLLRGDGDKRRKIRNINDVLLRQTGNPIKHLIYKVMKIYDEDQDHITVGMAMRTLSTRKKKRPVMPASNISKERWKLLYQQAEKESAKHSNNPFSMSNHAWKKLSPIYEGLAGSRIGDFYNRSPEFRDLEMLMRICSSSGIKLEVIVLPVNGRWYDYIGMDKSKRKAVDRKIKTLAKEYGAEFQTLSNYDYEQHIVEDRVHPWGKGWLKINEKIYDFCTEKEKQ